MTKQDFKALCTQHRANPRAVKEYMENKGLKRKEIEPVELLQLIYANCEDLLFCRNAGNARLEYTNPIQTHELIDAISKMKGV